MPIWTISHSLDDPKNPQWEKLVLDCLGSGVHPNRIQGFLLSRQALLISCKNLGLKLEISELKLGKTHQLLAHPALTISLSHTASAGAAIVAQRENFASLGIDIEQSSRVVKPEIAQRIAHPLDQSLRNIELWCLKEAALKALMNSDRFDAPIEFSSIQVNKHHWAHSASGLRGECQCEEKEGLMVATAFLI